MAPGRVTLGAGANYPPGRAQRERAVGAAPPPRIFVAPRHVIRPEGGPPTHGCYGPDMNRRLPRRPCNRAAECQSRHRFPLRPEPPCPPTPSTPPRSTTTRAPRTWSARSLPAPRARRQGGGAGQADPSGRASDLAPCRARGAHPHHAPGHRHRHVHGRHRGAAADTAPPAHQHAGHPHRPAHAQDLHRRLRRKPEPHRRDRGQGSPGWRHADPGQGPACARQPPHAPATLGRGVHGPAQGRPARQSPSAQKSERAWNRSKSAAVRRAGAP